MPKLSCWYTFDDDVIHDDVDDDDDADRPVDKCLVSLRSPPINTSTVLGELPGRRYTPDQQCQLIYGQQSYYCGVRHRIVCLLVLVNQSLDSLERRANRISASSNNMKLVHWALMGGLLHLVQRGGDSVGPQPVQASLRCTKCNSPSINGQCTNHRIAV